MSAPELAADLEARKASILERLDTNGDGDLGPEELARAPRGCMDTDEEEAAAGQVEAAALLLGSDEPRFLRGDAGGDGRVDLSDAVTLAGSLFLGSPAPNCMDAADSNDDGWVDLSDAITILVTLFRGTSGGTPGGIALPYPDTGADDTEDSLTCE